MKKPNIIIGKKQIILSCLTLILGVAVYTNYALSKDPAKAKDTPVNATPSSQTGGTNAGNTSKDGAKDGENGDSYGDTDFVNANTSEDFFAQARMEKVSNRDQAVQTLQSIIGGGDLTQDEMVTNAINAVELSALVEKEGEIESLIKANGFADCVVYLTSDSAKVVVKSEGLTTAQAASIKDIILGAITVPTENIRIFELQ
jgi:stage III sporulation protein AH